jgi:hypothetical protein
MLGLEFLAARSRLFRPEPAPDRRPADESTGGPEGEDDHPRDGKVGYGTGLIGLKNLRPWSQKPEAVVPKT